MILDVDIYPFMALSPPNVIQPVNIHLGRSRGKKLFKVHLIESVEQLQVTTARKHVAGSALTEQSTIVQKPSQL